ncbi:MAG: hypothetical protein ACI9QL_005065, partial [Candidatus Omnitrophota bacterium]
FRAVVAQPVKRSWIEKAGRIIFMVNA